MNIENCVKFKFEGIKDYFRSDNFSFYEFHSIEDFLNNTSKIKNNALILIYTEITNRAYVPLNGFHLVERFILENNKIVFFLLKDCNSFNKNIDFNINLEKKRFDGEIEISTICTDDEPYLSYMKEMISYYRKYNIKLTIAFFGIPPKFNYKNVNIKFFEKKNFTMSFARNKSLESTTHKYIIMTDIDIIVKKENIRKLIYKFNKLDNNGIFNLKNHEHDGNGIYFGEREKLIKNNYFEKFKGFYFEDSEYFMNFSRIGITPLVLGIDFLRKDSNCAQDSFKNIESSKYYTSNFLNMKKIIHEGRYFV